MAAFVVFAAVIEAVQDVPRDLVEPARMTVAGTPAEAPPSRRARSARMNPAWFSRGDGMEIYAEFRVVTRKHERAPATWLVDGFNVLNLALLEGAERAHFWGPAARDRLLELVAGWTEQGRVVVVFDGDRPMPESASSNPEVVFAPSADEWLLRMIREAEDPDRIAVVTADRRLAARARHRGAQVVAPAAFVARCRAQVPASSAS